MSVQVRYRREAASFLASFVGAQGEMLIDTTNNRVQVHDGATPGGFPAAKLSEVVANTRTAVADASYTALVGDRAIAVTSLTAPRTITLPAAATYPTGTQLLVFDESGACSSSNTITIARAGTDTINGASSANIATAYGYLAFETNGSSRWTIVDQTSGGAPAAMQNNYAATAYPTASNDITQGYAVGSRWLLPTTGEMFFCRDATAGAAVWNRVDNADFFGYVAGNWYLPFGLNGQAAGTTVAANRLLMFPWINKERFTLAALGLLVTTVSAGGNCQVALYASDPVTKQASGLPLGSTASMSTATAAPVNAAASAQIDPGFYWWAVNVDNTTVKFQSLTNTAPFVAQLIGASSETVAATNAANIAFYGISQTFGTWPNLTGVANPPAAASANYMPIVHYKVGSVP